MMGRDQLEKGGQAGENHAESAGWIFHFPQQPARDLPVQPAGPPARKKAVALRRLARTGSVKLEGIRSSIPRLLETERAYGHVFVFTPVFLGLGAFFWFSLPNDPAVVPLILLFAVSASLAVRLVYHQNLFSYSLAALALMTGGMLLAAFETRHAGTVVLDTPVTTMLTGTVAGRDIDERGRWRYLVDVTGTSDPTLRRPPERVRLLARSAHEAATLGQRIEGRVRLSPPSGPALSGLNDFSFSSYFNGIGAVGYFYGRPEVGDDTPAAVSSLPGLVLHPVKQWLASLRGAIGTHIRQTIGGDAGAIAAALVTAEERAIGDETIEALRQSGLAHVLAISGLNMVLAAGTFLIGARTLLCLVPGLAHRVPIKKISALFALVMVTFYILISGGAVSAVRSWIMICIMLVAVLFDRPSISMRNVAMSALIILVITPSAVTGAGFQMSFAATLALVAGYAAWRDRPDREDEPVRIAVWQRLRPIGQFFGGLLLSSFIGGLSTMVYSIGHFHRIPAYGLIGNLLAMPVISIIVMPAGLVAMLLMPFGLDHYPLLLMGLGLDWVIVIARSVSGWGGEIATGKLAPAAFFLIALGGIVACLLRTRLAVLGGLLIGAGVVMTLWPASAPRPVLVVSEDGELVALVKAESMAVNRDKPPAFIADQWRRSLKLTDTEPSIRRDDVVSKDPPEQAKTQTGRQDRRHKQKKPPIDRMAAKAAMLRLLAETPQERFACAAKQWCAARSQQGWRVITVDDPRFLGPACDSGDIVIVRARLRLTECRSGAVLITGQSLRRSGALEIRARQPVPGMTAGNIGDKIEITGAMTDVRRPWTRHRLYDWRRDRFDDEPGEGEIAVSGSGE